MTTFTTRNGLKVELKDNMKCEICYKLVQYVRSCKTCNYTACGNCTDKLVKSSCPQCRSYDFKYDKKYMIINFDQEEETNSIIVCDSFTEAQGMYIEMV